MTTTPHPKARRVDDFRKLLPCPFCGGTPRFQVARSGSSQYPHAWQIVCDSCQCKRFTLAKTIDAALDGLTEDWNCRNVSKRKQVVPVEPLDINEGFYDEIS